MYLCSAILRVGMDQQNNHRLLSELENSESGVIVRVMGQGSFRKRITEMGFIRGKRVRVIKNAPMQDPVEYQIMGYHVALRRSEAELIEVQLDRPADTAPRKKIPLRPTLEDQGANRFLHDGGNTINVALVGNPNCGKTTLFNHASGSHERVGNYGGVTVDSKVATVRHAPYTIHLTDLPGTYSITEYTPEELFVRNHILGQMPDVVVNVVDASNLERNLFLTTQLIDMNLKVVIALNMYDELERSGARFDYRMLGQMIGIPIVPTVASRGEGIDALFDTVADVFEDNEPVVRHIHIHYGEDIEHSIELLQEPVRVNCDVIARYSARYLAIKLLEGDKATDELLRPVPNYAQIRALADHEAAKLEKFYNDRVETEIANAKYGFIAGALGETLQPGPGDNNHQATNIDRVLTHRIWGFPLFLFFMWVMFQATFTLGSYPADWIEQGVSWLGEALGGVMADGSLKELLINGVIGGVGGVLVFLPNILILFFFISMMEDTGYMARTSFMMDRLMHRIGLHGKSFIPLLMGFGCNVPAIMAVRTLESRKDRVLTALIMPFISCSARLPVYVLLISAFFPKGQGAVLLSIYLIGILVAILTSLGLKRIFFRKQEAPFVMELPPYRIPTLRSVTRHMWNKGVQYLRKMGSVILIASVLIWALGYYPQSEGTPAQQQEKSYIGQLGHAVEPVIRPLGFDWKIGVSLLTGFAAKEVVVSTMAVLNNSGEEEEGLVETLRQQRHTSGVRAGQPVYTPLVAYGLMLFTLLYVPCVAAIAAIRREAGGRWALFSVVYSTAVAWVAALLVYQVGNWIG